MSRIIENSSRNRVCRASPIWHWVILLVVATGCASTGPPPAEPFSQYSEGIKTLSGGVDDALKELQERSRQRLLAQAQSLDVEAIIALGLEPDPNDPFTVTPNGTIIYIKLTRLRSGVNTLNGALQGYANSLVELSSPELVSDKQVDTWATELNQNLRSAAVAFGADNAAAKESALISTAASEAFKVYIRSRQLRDLISALQRNQPQIGDAAQQGQTALKAMATELRTIYAVDYRSVIDPITPTRDEPNRSTNLSAEQKRQLVHRLLDLNAEYETRMSILRELHEAYRTLPAAHAQLFQSLERQQMDMTAALQLVESGLRLRQYYEELRDKAATTAPSDY